MSKKYNTKEMLIKLLENPEKKFVSEENTITEGMAHIRQNCIFIGNPREFITIHTDREWKEVKEPVTFKKAIESGKRILVEHSRIPGRTSGYMELSDMLKYLGSLPSIEAGIIIRNGNWYIEEEL